MAASTYVVSGSRAGRSAIVAETTTKTYAVAMPAILQETASTGPTAGVGSTVGFAIILA